MVFFVNIFIVDSAGGKVYNVERFWKLQGKAKYSQQKCPEKSYLLTVYEEKQEK